VAFAGSALAVSAASVGVAEQAHAAAAFCGGRSAISPSTPIEPVPVVVTSKDCQELIEHGRKVVVDGLRRRAVGVGVLPYSALPCGVASR
jgi:hypothetical protein